MDVLIYKQAIPKIYLSLPYWVLSKIAEILNLSRLDASHHREQKTTFSLSGMTSSSKKDKKQHCSLWHCYVAVFPKTGMERVVTNNLLQNFTDSYI